MAHDVETRSVRIRIGAHHAHNGLGQLSCVLGLGHVLGHYAGAISYDFGVGAHNGPTKLGQFRCVLRMGPILGPLYWGNFASSWTWGMAP